MRGKTFGDDCDATDRSGDHGARPAACQGLDLPDDLPAVVADGQRITQVVTNLSNAHKYTPEGGSIAILRSAQPRRRTRPRPTSFVGSSSWPKRGWPT